jgi:TetR/AcrR family transcriptional repressor of acrEF/envCD operon
MNNTDSFNLYQQAPALVDNILATLPVYARRLRMIYSSAPGNISLLTKRLNGLRTDRFT